MEPMRYQRTPVHHLAHVVVQGKGHKIREVGIGAVRESFVVEYFVLGRRNLGEKKLVITTEWEHANLYRNNIHLPCVVTSLIVSVWLLVIRGLLRESHAALCAFLPSSHFCFSAICSLIFSASIFWALK